MSRIYLASPLHDKEDRDYYTPYVKALREYYHSVYVPAEHGVWEEELKKFGGDAEKCRRHFFELDIAACNNADYCVAMFNPRRRDGPSEGMIFEMGYMYALHKNILLYNQQGMWTYNLMPEFASTVFTDFSDLLAYILEEGPDGQISR